MNVGKVWKDKMLNFQGPKMIFKGLKSAKDNIFLIWCQTLLSVKGSNGSILLAINSGEFEVWRHKRKIQELILEDHSLTDILFPCASSFDYYL